MSMWANVGSPALYCWPSWLWMWNNKVPRELSGLGDHWRTTWRQVVASIFPTWQPFAHTLLLYPPQCSAGLLIMKLWKILPSFPLLQKDVLLGQCGSGIRRKNFSLRGDLVHINETLIIYTCFVFELEKKIKLCPTCADSRKHMCSIQEQLLSIKHHHVKNIDFYASQEVLFCSIYYLQDLA